VLTIIIRNGIPCVIKVGGRKTTFLNEGLTRAIEEYVSTRGLSDDPVRHGKVGASVGSQELLPSEHSAALAQDSTTEAGNSEAGAFAARGCVLIHRRFASRMENKTHDIKLGRGPAETYKTKKGNQALEEFAAKLLPLTQLVEAIYSVFLPDEFAKYKKVFDFLNGPLADNIDIAFGVWTSRSLVFDALSNIHRDLEDVCRGWCALVPCGNFEGGNACFPSLGAKLELPVGKCFIPQVMTLLVDAGSNTRIGAVVFMRSYALEHYIGAFTGTRYSVVHFTHQSVHDFYAQETGELLWAPSEMPA